MKESFGDGSKPRNMDRLRRSLRSSIRKKKNKDNWTDLPQNSNNGAGSKMSSEGGKPHQWQSDEISVRSGTCNFHVKVRSKSKHLIFILKYLKVSLNKLIFQIIIQPMFVIISVFGKCRSIRLKRNASLWRSHQGSKGRKSSYVPNVFFSEH